VHGVREVHRVVVRLKPSEVRNGQSIRSSSRARAAAAAACVLGILLIVCTGAAPQEQQPPPLQPLEPATPVPKKAPVQDDADAPVETPNLKAPPPVQPPEQAAPAAKKPPVPDDAAAAAAAEISNLKAQLTRLEERVKELEVATFDAVQALEAICGSRDFAACRKHFEDRGQKIAVAPRPPDEKPPERDEPEPTRECVIARSDGFKLVCNAANRPLWTLREVEGRGLKLPAAAQCEAVGTWLLGRSERSKNVFYVSGVDDDPDRIGVCDEVDDRWQVFEASSTPTAHVIVVD
jgi:hypothetical protein